MKNPAIRTNSAGKCENDAMTVRRTSAVIMAGVSVVTMLNAPAADARPTCQSTDFKTICQTNGSVSIKARPGTLAPPGNLPHIPWWGVGGRRRR
jgi:hypothetical protein